MIEQTNRDYYLIYRMKKLLIALGVSDNRIPWPLTQYHVGGTFQETWKS